jgi:hypothetical protein
MSRADSGRNAGRKPLTRQLDLIKLEEPGALRPAPPPPPAPSKPAPPRSGKPPAKPAKPAKAKSRR